MRARHRVFVARLAALATATAALGGCDRRGDGERRSLVLATTTSTDDSGLLEVLVPRFEAETGIRAKVIAVGSGQALMLGERGEVDVLLVHAPSAEEAFMAAGHGESRQPVMHNRFVVVGPPSDPAGVKGSSSAAAALAAIAAAGAPFVTRGDDSGTHARERQLWKTAGVEPSGPWYLDGGQGMGATLALASEKRAYTLSDLGTYLARRQGLELAVLVDRASDLRNRYHVIVVAAKAGPRVAVEEGRAFARFVTSAETQAEIGRFGVDRFGEPLFIPDAAGAGDRP